MFKYKKFSNFIQEKPEILAYNSQFNFKNSSKLNITFDELKETMHQHRVEKSAKVKLAIIEIDCNIGIISGNKNLKQTYYKKV